jgi:hypothetical protein
MERHYRCSACFWQGTIDATVSARSQPICPACGQEFSSDAVVFPEDRSDQVRQFPDSTPTDQSGLATISFLTGAAAALTWWCPPCGLIAAAVGIITGAYGLHSRIRGLATLGILLSTIGGTLSLGCGVIYGIVIVHEQQLDDLPANENQPPFFNR